MTRNLVARFGLFGIGLQIVAGQLQNGSYFHRETLGVAFRPFVKNPENGVIPGLHSYDTGNVMTMLRKVATRFSLIMSFGMGSSSGTYTPGQTYSDCNSLSLTAEGAALLNRERGNLSLSVLLGVWQSGRYNNTRTEIQVALEAAQMANAIFPGTVTGLIFQHYATGTSLSITRQTLEQIRDFKPLLQERQLVIGVRQTCSSDLESEKEMVKVQREIVMESDIVMCRVFPWEDNQTHRIEPTFRNLGLRVLDLKKEIQRINPKVEFVAMSGFPSHRPTGYYSAQNMGKFWHSADDWAVANQVPVYMMEAFDQPFRESGDGAHWGWWKLENNSGINSEEAYLEKTSLPPELPQNGNGANTSTSSGIGITITNDPNPSEISQARFLFWLPLVVPVATTFFLICVCINSTWIQYNKAQSKRNQVAADIIREFLQGLSDHRSRNEGEEMVESALAVPYDRRYEIEKNRIKILDEVLGSGEFGVVFKAFIRSRDDYNTRLTVALKVAKQNASRTALRSLLYEIKILTFLGPHHNIVSIQGAYTSELEATGVVYLATELCEMGSLEQYLRTAASSGGTVDDKDMIRWCREIGCAMVFLQEKKVVHADLATRNVLLTSERQAKVTDFGLSRRLYQYTEYVKKHQEPLPWRWMAPESLTRLEFSSRSDVWSFGITMWEIYSMANVPYAGLSWSVDFANHLGQGLRPSRPPRGGDQVYELMTTCWNLDPKARPEFPQIVAALQKNSNYNNLEGVIV